MTPQELAAQIDGAEYPFGLWPEHRAGDNGLVVVYGSGDDLIEVRGAIKGEGDCYEGGTFLIDKQGLLPEWNQVKNDETDASAYLKRKPSAKQIEVIWDKDDISWQYKTDIPHATFKIMEDGEVYCIGMVFDIKELEA